MSYNTQVTYRQKLSRNINLYYLTQFCEFLVFIIPIWVSYQRQFLSFTQMSLVASSRWAITALLELPSGAIADLIGRRLSTVIGYTIQALGIGLIALATGPHLIVIGSLLQGVGESFVSGANVALVYDSLKELKQESRFTKIRSQATFLAQFSIVIAMLMGGYLYQLWKGLPYVVFALASAAAAVSSLFFQEPKIDTEKFSLANYVSQVKRGVGETFKTAFNAQLSIYYGLVGGVSWAWQFYFNQIYASEIGYSEVGKSWLFTIIRLANVFLIIRLLRLDKLLTKSRMFLFFPLLMVASALPAMIPNQVLGTGLLFGMVLASTMRYVVLDQYTNEVLESKYRATALSALNLYVSIVFIIFVAMSGPVMDKFGVGVVYSGVGLLMLLILFPLGFKLANHK